MPSKYKLTYYNLRGLAELSRLILAQAGVEYEDVRFDYDGHGLSKDIKKTLPFGKVPVLEFDGKVIAESRAIARFLAREYGFAGKNNFEAAQCDMIVDSWYDLSDSLYMWQEEKDEAKKAEMIAHIKIEQLEPLLDKYQAMLTKNGTGYFVGNSLTWADIAVAAGVDDELAMLPSVIESHQKLVELKTRVLNLPRIKAWIDKRPVTPM